MLRTASNEATLISEMPIVIDKVSVFIAPGQGKRQISLLNDYTREQWLFL